jgi:hypothetical protein
LGDLFQVKAALVTETPDDEVAERAKTRMIVDAQIAELEGRLKLGS